MSTYISKGGKWVAAKERIGLINKSNKAIEYNGQTIQPGDPFIYEGPDREALLALHKEGNKDAEGNLYLGQDFQRNPEFLQAVRNMGFESGESGIKKYLDHIGYDEKEEEKLFKEKSVSISSHEAPKKVKAIKEIGGGKDFSGNRKDRYGDFGSPPEIG